MYCKHCYKMIDDDVDVCPYCKQSQNVPAINTKMILLVSIAIILILVCLITASSFVQRDQQSDIQDKTAHYSNSLPMTLALGDKTATMKEVKFFEIYGNHGYQLNVMVTIDRTSLTDDDIYWMTNVQKDFHRELSMNFFIDHDENGLENLCLSPFQTVYDNENIYYCFQSDVFRYPLMNASCNVQIVYAKESIADPDTKWYHYSFDITEENNSDSIDVLTPDEMRIFLGLYD